MLEVVDVATGAVVAGSLRVADTHLARLKGLLGTRELPAGEGLWIKPCQQVHMFGMRYGLDVVFLDDQLKVVHLEQGLMPWKVSARIEQARSVIELPLGSIRRTGLALGDSVSIAGDPAPAASAWFDAAAAFLCNLALAAVYGFFAAAHVRAISRTGDWVTTLPFVAQESMLVMLFLTRRRSFGTTGNLVDWLVGIGGTCLPLFLRPADGGSSLAAIGVPIQVLGFILATCGLMSLGRSVGVVAANRGIQTDGFYRLVRHPVYAAYTVGYIGYNLCHPSPRNLLLTTTTFLLLLLRVQAEERFLKRDPVYLDYAERVPWRLLPFIY